MHDDFDTIPKSRSEETNLDRCYEDSIDDDDFDNFKIPDLSVRFSCD